MSLLVGGLVYLAIWGAAMAYLAVKGADWSFPIISLVIFGIILSGIAWALTIGARPTVVEVRRPGVETSAIIVYLALYAVLFLGFGMGTLRTAIPAGQTQEWAVLGAKLLVHVVLPAGLLLLVGARLAPMFRGGPRPIVFWRTLVVMAALIIGLTTVVTPALGQLSKLNPAVMTLAWAAPLSFAWIFLEAGLCEEFLYRAAAQTRLEEVFRSPTTGIAAASLIFALAHAPGLFLRGGPDTDGWSTDPIQVIAFTLASLSPIAITFGVLWVRTRSLILCAILHACVDFLPNLPGFIEMWAS